jgi:hypothetical protein
MLQAFGPVWCAGHGYAPFPGDANAPDRETTMLLDNDRRRAGGHSAEPPRDAFQAAPTASALRRFLGGSPAGVFVRLLFLSVLVGAFMSMLGVTPGLLFWRVVDSVQDLVHLAATQLHDITGWIVAGAIVVVPLWLIARLFAVSR